MASVRDNEATNNDDITTTPQQKLNIFGGKKNMKFNDHVTNDQGIKDHDSTHISSFSV